MASGYFMLAAGTDEGHIYLRQGWSQDYTNPRIHGCGTKPLIDVKFSKNGHILAAASLDQHIYILRYSDGDYVPNSACALEQGFPVSINFSEDSSKLVINSNQRKLLVLDPNTLDLLFKKEDLQNCLWTRWNSKYPTITKTANSPMMPIVLGNESNIVAAGDENGTVYLWKDIDSIKEHIGSNYQTHTTSV
jgi:WD40 repeat protein